jgi:hypothetical protein
MQNGAMQNSLHRGKRPCISVPQLPRQRLNRLHAGGGAARKGRTGRSLYACSNDSLWGGKQDEQVLIQTEIST